jgi:hypothetical protein
MTTEFEFEKKIRHRDLVKKESSVTMLIGLAVQAAIVILGAVAYLVKPVQRLTPMAENVYMVFCVIAVVVVIVVLAVRRTIYFSPRLIGDGVDLSALLAKWRTIDIVLLVCTEGVAIMGFVVRMMGLPFSRTLTFFVGSFVLGMILMPFTFKVMDKIRYVERQIGK